MKWFDENLTEIEPFLRSHVVVVDEDIEFFAPPDLVDRVRTLQQPAAPERDPEKAVCQSALRRIARFWIVGMEDSEPVCIVPDGKGGSSNGFKFAANQVIEAHSEVSGN
jgi:hypothetical protein